MTHVVPRDELCPTMMAALRASPVERQAVIGCAPRAWANHIADGLGEQFDLDRDRIDRSRLISLAQEASPEKFFLSVMAWGGMKVGHGVSAWSEREVWYAPLQAALRGDASRRELYAGFAAKPVNGMRAAYFTKLIHFATVRSAEPVGYIMDQWTAKSVNLICRRDIVVLDAAGYVTPANDDRVYEQFCQIVDAIAAELGVAGAEAEERIYSRGGRRPAAWRAHVKANWRPNGGAATRRRSVVRP